MPRCKECGADYSASDKFCPECGKRLKRARLATASLACGIAGIIFLMSIALLRVSMLGLLFLLSPFLAVMAVIFGSLGILASRKRKGMLWCLIGIALGLLILAVLYILPPLLRKPAMY